MQVHSVFLTKVGSPAEKNAARLLIESIQTFGGEMRSIPIWVFATDQQADYSDLASAQVEVFALPVPEKVQSYPFGDKVWACAQAEKQASAEMQSFIWLDLECLVVQPPILYALENAYDAALRPVHIRNVGLSPTEPLDNFWRGIYREIGVEDIPFQVETFIDRQLLRAYFNSHGFSINPQRGLLQRWYAHFETLVNDQQFQALACEDARHKIFLFQAVWSALLASTLPPSRIRILPPTYNYPYNLHDRVEVAQRATTMNELVSFTFEGRDIHPKNVRDIQIHEPLRTWLEARRLPTLE